MILQLLHAQTRVVSQLDKKLDAVTANLDALMAQQLAAPATVVPADVAHAFPMNNKDDVDAVATLMTTDEAYLNFVVS